MTYPPVKLLATKPDFSTVWALRATGCDATRDPLPLTPLEARVAKTGGVTAEDLHYIWEACSSIDPEDVYAEADFVPSAEQLPELQAYLVLCPRHPHAKAWKASLARGLQRSKQVIIDGDGNYTVGKDVKPGTYVTEGAVTDCYWERVDSSGRTIDNDFVTGAPRVKVTIRSSDAGFNTDGCGTWIRQ